MATQSDVFFPFDAGAGSTVTEAQWPLLALCWGSMANHERGGVVDTGGGTDLLVTAPGSAREVSMAVGTAIVDGHILRFDSPVTIPIATNSTGAERLDVIVLRTDRANNRGEVDVITGATLTLNEVNELQQDANVWEVEIARVFAPTGSGNITSAMVDESRIFVDTPRRDLIGSYIYTRRAASSYRNITASGLTVAKATYRLLYNLVGGHGADPSSRTFVASPDVVSNGGLLRANLTPGQVGGASSVTLTKSQMPPHDHVLTPHTHLPGTLGLNTGGVQVVIGDVGNSTQWLNSGALANHGNEDVSYSAAAFQGQTAASSSGIVTGETGGAGSPVVAQPISIAPLSVGAFIQVVAR